MANAFDPVLPTRQPAVDPAERTRERSEIYVCVAYI